MIYSCSAVVSSFRGQRRALYNKAKANFSEIHVIKNHMAREGKCAVEKINNKINRVSCPLEMRKRYR